MTNKFLLAASLAALMIAVPLEASVAKNGGGGGGGSGKGSPSGGKVGPSGGSGKGGPGGGGGKSYVHVGHGHGHFIGTGRHFWHGRWYEYGVGPCWWLAPDGSFWWTCD